LVKITSRHIAGERAAAVNCKHHAGFEDCEQRLDSTQMLHDLCAADLDLEPAMTAIRRATNLIARERNVILAAAAPSARAYRYSSARVGETITRECSPQRFATRLRGKIPNRHIDETDGAASLAVTRALLVLHHDAPDPTGGRFRHFDRRSARDRRL
jgi:hypothetical protein